MDTARRVAQEDPHHLAELSTQSIGVSMSHEDLQKTVEVCKKYDIVCSDETYADIYDTDPPASLLEGDLSNVLVIHSLSKRSGMTGYRSGFVAGDPEIMQTLDSLSS